MGAFWEHVFPEPIEWLHLGRLAGRLLVACLIGGLVGINRELVGKAAGVRTHMLVALGAAIFTLTPSTAGMPLGDLSRVIQGVATGIGFLGAGTILKQSEQGRVRGLTTAAAIWLTAAAGMAVGAGWIWPSVFSVVLAWVVLGPMHRLERWLKRRQRNNPQR